MMNRTYHLALERAWLVLWAVAFRFSRQKDDLLDRVMLESCSRSLGHHEALRVTKHPETT